MSEDNDYWMGMVVAYEEIARKIRSRASRAFENQLDDLAKILRSLADELEDQAKCKREELKAPKEK